MWLQVHVVTRYGERPMVGDDFDELGEGMINKLQPDCTLDAPHKLHELTEFQAYKRDMWAMLNSSKTLDLVKKYSLYPSHRGCAPYRLTGYGAVQHLATGLNLRKAYLDLRTHGLLSGGANISKIYVQMTATSRTFQSAIAFLYGFLPKFDLANLIQRFKLARENFCENWDDPYHCLECSSLDSIHTQAMQAYRSQISDSPLKTSVRRDICEIQGYVSGCDFVDLINLQNYLDSYMCHKLPFPCYRKSGKCFSQQLVWKMLTLREYELKVRKTAYEKYSQLLYHPFLTRLVKTMKSTMSYDAGSFHLYIGQVTSVHYLAYALGLDIGKDPPPFASRLVFELYKKVYTTGDNGNYMLRVLYNGHVVTDDLTFCGVSKTSADGLCDVRQFYMHMENEHLKQFDTTSYDHACQGK